MINKVSKKRAIVKPREKKAAGPTGTEAPQTPAPAAKQAAAKKPAAKIPAKPSKAVKKPAPALTAAAVQKIVADALAVEREASNRQMMMLVSIINPQLGKIDTLTPFMQGAEALAASVAGITERIDSISEQHDALAETAGQLVEIREQLKDSAMLGVEVIRDHADSTIKALAAVEVRSTAQMQGLRESLRDGQTAMEATIQKESAPLIAGLSATATKISTELGKFVGPIVAIQADLTTLSTSTASMEKAAVSLTASAQSNTAALATQQQVQHATVSILTEIRAALVEMQKSMQVIAAIAAPEETDHE